MKFSAVLLDADMTVLDFDRAERRALAATLEEAFSEAGAPRLSAADGEAAYRTYHEINAGLWATFERGGIEKAEIGPRRFRELFGLLRLRCDPIRTNERYMARIAASGDLMAGAREFLEELSERTRIYLATNGTARLQRARVEAAGIGKYLSGIFVSEEAGAPKPQRAFYDHVFSVLGEGARKSTAAVGDSLRADVLGALGAGIAAVWYNPTRLAGDPSIRPTFEAHSYGEITEYLTGCGRNF